jgi:hypothetical protein
MKESKKKTNTSANFTGLVVKKTFGAGSKSQHEGIFLETEAGESYKLKRMGGNPFNDPELNKLVGKTIAVSGIADQNLLIAKSIKPLK